MTDLVSIGRITAGGWNVGATFIAFLIYIGMLKGECWSEPKKGGCDKF
jgi:hypothetical protein